MLKLHNLSLEETKYINIPPVSHTNMYAGSTLDNMNAANEIIDSLNVLNICFHHLLHIQLNQRMQCSFLYFSFQFSGSILAKANHFRYWQDKD